MANIQRTELVCDVCLPKESSAYAVCHFCKRDLCLQHSYLIQLNNRSGVESLVYLCGNDIQTMKEILEEVEGTERL